MANRNRINKLVVPQAEAAMQRMKAEIAAELGLPDYENMDKGALPSRINGMVGGTITKRLIELGQQALTQDQTNGSITNATSNLRPQEYVQEAVSELERANKSTLQ